MAIETGTASVTVRVNMPVTVPSFAEMTVVPLATDVATPMFGAVFEIVAVPGVADAHVTCVVRSCVVVSVKVPVATNFAVVPLAIDGVVVVTAIDTSAAGVTVSTVEPMIVPLLAVFVVVPSAK